MKAWLLWLLTCVLALGGLAAILAAAALHSPKYGAHSVAVGLGILGGIEILLCAFFVGYAWWTETEKSS